MPSSSASANTPAASQPRLALAVGNDFYQYLPPLAFAVNDVNRITSALTLMQFSVFKYHNLSRQGINDAVDSFLRALSPNSLVFFYYSGHGGFSKDVQFNNESANFLLPIDFEKTAQLQQCHTDENWCANRILESITQRCPEGGCICVFDSCRSQMKGTAFPEHLKFGTSNINISGTLVGYACDEGHTSVEVDGGLYTQSLLQHLFRNEDIGVVFRSANHTLSQNRYNQGPYRQRSRFTDLLRIESKFVLNPNVTVPDAFLMPSNRVLCRQQPSANLLWSTKVRGLQEYREIIINEKVLLCSKHDDWLVPLSENDILVTVHCTAVNQLGDERPIVGMTIWETVADRKSATHYCIRNKAIKNLKRISEDGQFVVDDNNRVYAVDECILFTEYPDVFVLNELLFVPTDVVAAIGGYWVKVQLPRQADYEGYIHSNTIPEHIKQLILPY